MDLKVTIHWQMKSPTGPIAGGSGLLQYRNRQSSASQRATGDNRSSYIQPLHFVISISETILKHDIRVHESKHYYAGNPLSCYELRLARCGNNGLKTQNHWHLFISNFLQFQVFKLIVHRYRNEKEKTYSHLYKMGKYSLCKERNLCIRLLRKDYKLCI